MHDSSKTSSSASRHRPAPWARARDGRPPARPVWRLQLGQLARHPVDGWRLADPVWWPGATRRAFRGLCRALCPPPPAPASDAIYDRIEDDVRRSLRYMHPLFALGLVGMVHILDTAPLWARRRPTRLSSLPREQAAELLQALTRTPLGRQLVFAGRMSILSMYFDLDEVHEALDYRPVDFMAERIRTRQQLLRARDANGSNDASHAADDDDDHGDSDSDTGAARIGPWSATTDDHLAPLDALTEQALAATTTTTTTDPGAPR